MEQEIYITLRFNFATGKVNLNEIVYRLKEIGDALMLDVLKKILMSYDDLISERLSKTTVYGSKERKGLGRHIRKSASGNRFCRGRKVRKRGYRQAPRNISTVFGGLKLPVRVVECCRCATRYSPLLSALGIEPYARKETNFEHEVIESVIDTNYRRLIDGRSIDISLGGIHNIVVGSDIGKTFQETVSTEGLSAIMADGTGVKQKGGNKGELRAVIGSTKGGRVKPLGCFVNTPWPEVEQRSQRCTWHGPRGLYHSLWEDGLKKKGSQPYTDKIKQLIGVELPEGDFEILKEEDKSQVRNKYETNKTEIQEVLVL